MFILDQGYANFKSTYIQKLADHYTQYNHLQSSNIKNVLLGNKIQNIEIKEDGSIIFTIEEDALFKALLGDILLLYIRSILQHNDTKYIEKELNISANWKLVTDYYAAYYDASMLQRLCFRGSVYLDNEYKRQLNLIVSFFTGSPKGFDSNYIYRIIEDRSGYKLKLEKTSVKTHELVWMMTDQLLSVLEKQSKKSSEEEKLLLGISNINKELGTAYPSKLRNLVNYRLEYGQQYVDKKLYPMTKKRGWAKYLGDFGYIDKRYKFSQDINQQLQIYSAYTSYIHMLGYRLLYDYFEMRPQGEDYILPKINKDRLVKIEREEIGWNAD